MQKLLIYLTGLILLIFPSFAFAQPINVQITQPNANGKPLGVVPNPDLLGKVLNNAFTIIFIAAALLVLFFLVIGAFKWITSGGDKEKIDGARKTITNALVGLAILALSFLIIAVLGRILGINILGSLQIPTLSQ